MLFDTRYFWTLFTSKDQDTVGKLRGIYEKSRAPCVSSISIFEVVKLTCATEGKEVAALRAHVIEGEFDVIDVDPGVATTGGEVSHRLRIPMADALIMATAMRLRLPCVTDDPHFSEVKTVWI
jgi:predicted nucleic acid-binding protein